MRDDFHADLDSLGERLVEMADIADEMLADAVDAVLAHDADRAQQVVRRDQVVDRIYFDNQQAILRALALQAPVAGDLRLVAGMLHVNIHIERMGDYATSVSRMVGRSADLRDSRDLTEQLAEMGQLAREVGQAAVRSFSRQDLAAAHAVPRLDDAVDDRHWAILDRMLDVAASDRSRLEWAREMLLVPRALERYGDHGVDIAEQTIFVITGETVELSSNEAGPTVGT